MSDRVMENRRKALRTRTLYGGTVMTLAGAPIAACTIRSSSQLGAQIKLPTDHILPNEFVLLDEKRASGHRAKVAWRRSNFAGVRFEESFPVSGALPPHLEVLRAILARAKLRQVTDLMEGGLTIQDALANANVGYAQYRQWEKKYGAKENDVTELQARIKELERENRTLNVRLAMASIRRMAPLNQRGRS